MSDVEYFKPERALGPAEISALWRHLDGDRHELFRTILHISNNNRLMTLRNFTTLILGGDAPGDNAFKMRLFMRQMGVEVTEADVTNPKYFTTGKSIVSDKEHIKSGTRFPLESLSMEDLKIIQNLKSVAFVWEIVKPQLRVPLGAGTFYKLAKGLPGYVHQVNEVSRILNSLTDLARYRKIDKQPL